MLSTGKRKKWRRIERATLVQRREEGYLHCKKKKNKMKKITAEQRLVQENKKQNEL